MAAEPGFGMQMLPELIHMAAVTGQTAAVRN